MEISQIQSGSWRKFENAIEEEKISSAYIIQGPSGSGKEALALQFISQILSSKITGLFKLIILITFEMASVF